MDSSLTSTFVVDQTPQQAFDAINDVRAWWSGTLEGPTDVLGAEWSYSVPGIHFSRFRTTELEPGKRIAWLVLDSWLSFVEDKEEWTGTTVVFDIHEVDGRTHVRFTHEGLTPRVECFEVCERAWGEYIDGSLRNFIESGAGRPNSFEGEAALAAAQRGEPFVS